MNLRQYISIKKMTASAFADLVGANKGLVSKWINNTVRPTERYYIKINTITKGKVMPNDFYNFKGIDDE